MSFKKCMNCATTKPMDDFYNLKKARDGKQTQCKQCQIKRYEHYVKKIKASPASIIKTSKKCQICKNIKPISMFGNSNNKPDKKMSYCKPCWVQYVATAKKRQLKRSKV